jgi:hypothetical protein
MSALQPTIHGIHTTCALCRRVSTGRVLIPAPPMVTPRCPVPFRGGTSLRNVLTGLRAMRSQRPIRHPDSAWLLSSLVGMTAVATILDPLHAYVVSDMSPPQNRCSALCPSALHPSLTHFFLVTTQERTVRMVSRYPLTSRRLPNCRLDASLPCASCKSRSVCLMPEGSSFPTWPAPIRSTAHSVSPNVGTWACIGHGPSSFRFRSDTAIDVFSPSPQTYLGAAHLLSICSYNPDLGRPSLPFRTTTHHC